MSDPCWNAVTQYVAQTTALAVTTNKTRTFAQRQQPPWRIIPVGKLLLSSALQAVRSLCICSTRVETIRHGQCAKGSGHWLVAGTSCVTSTA